MYISISLSYNDASTSGRCSEAGVATTAATRKDHTRFCFGLHEQWDKNPHPFFFLEQQPTWRKGHKTERTGQGGGGGGMKDSDGEFEMHVRSTGM